MGLFDMGMTWGKTSAPTVKNTPNTLATGHTQKDHTPADPVELTPVALAPQDVAPSVSAVSPLSAVSPISPLSPTSPVSPVSTISPLSADSAPDLKSWSTPPSADEPLDSWGYVPEDSGMYEDDFAARALDTDEDGADMMSPLTSSEDATWDDAPEPVRTQVVPPAQPRESFAMTATLTERPNIFDLSAVTGTGRVVLDATRARTEEMRQWIEDRPLGVWWPNGAWTDFMPVVGSEEPAPAGRRTVPAQSLSAIDPTSFDGAYVTRWVHPTSKVGFLRAVLFKGDTIVSALHMPWERHDAMFALLSVDTPASFPKDHVMAVGVAMSLAYNDDWRLDLALSNEYGLTWPHTHTFAAETVSAPVSGSQPLKGVEAPVEPPKASTGATEALSDPEDHTLLLEALEGIEAMIALAGDVAQSMDDRLDLGYAAPQQAALPAQDTDDELLLWYDFIFTFER